MQDIIVAIRNTGCFSCWWMVLGVRKSVPKKLKTIFFQNKFYLKAHTHYFTVLILLATRGAANLGILLSLFFFFFFCKLTQLLFTSTYHSRDCNSLYYQYPKKFSVLPSEWTQLKTDSVSIAIERKLVINSYAWLLPSLSDIIYLFIYLFIYFALSLWLGRIRTVWDQKFEQTKSMKI